MTDYKLSTPVDVDELRQADGVFTNGQGEWLGEVIAEQDGEKVMPLTDEDGDYIPAPDGWQNRAVQI